MKNWDIRDETGKCMMEKDYDDARYICDKLKIPLIQVDFVKEYWNEVFRYMEILGLLSITSDDNVIFTCLYLFQWFIGKVSEWLYSKSRYFVQQEHQVWQIFSSRM